MSRTDAGGGHLPNQQYPLGSFVSWPNGSNVLDMSEDELSQQLRPNSFAWSKTLRAFAAEAKRCHTEMLSLRNSRDELLQLRQTVSKYSSRNLHLEERKNNLEDQLGVMARLMEKAKVSDFDFDPRSGSSRKYPDPDKFSIEIKMLEGWFKQISLKLHANADWYPIEQDKLDYVVSRLEGRARDQINSMTNDSKIVEFKTVEDLLQELKRAFSDPYRAMIAANKVSRMRQTNQDFSTYIAEFKREVDYTNWNDSAKKHALLMGLSKEMKYALAITNTYINTLDYLEVIEICQTIDINRRILQLS